MIVGVRSALGLGLGGALAVALLFGSGFCLGRAQRHGDQRIIEVTDEVVAGLRADHRRRTGRAPTAVEDQVLLARHVDQEILYREALARGLERSDVIVRRRLLQLMELRAEDEVTQTPPSEAELAAELAANPERYRRPAQISFSQVFVARGPGDAQEAARVLARLRGGAEAASQGQPFVRGHDFGSLSRAEVEAIFGAGFAAALLALPASADGRWSGPLASSFGLHLVEVSGRAPARVATLAEARPRVAADLVEHRRAHARDLVLEGWRTRYRVRRLDHAR